MPDHWNKLYSMLPGRGSDEGGRNVPLPLILAAWWNSSNREKSDRLAEHLKWAKAHDVLEHVSSFLHELREEDWHHQD